MDNLTSRKELVVVLLLGDDNMSRMVDAEVDDEYFKLYHPSCHLVKLEYGSADAQFFKNIYPDRQSPFCIVIEQYGLVLKTIDFNGLEQFSSDIIRPFLSGQIFETLDEVPETVRYGEPDLSLDEEVEQMLERFEKAVNDNVNTLLRKTTIIIIRSPSLERCIQQFYINDPLNKLYNYVDENIVGHSRYTLSVTYPRRIFTNEERHMTFRQLNLHRNAVVNVILNREVENNNILTVATQVIFSIWRSIIYPFVRIFRVSGDIFSNIMPSQPIAMQRQ